MKTLLLSALTLLLAGSGLTANAQLVINELMQSNVDCLMDDQKEFPDSWVELYNTSNAPCSVDGYQMGVLPDASTAWTLPSGTVPAHGFLIIYCDRVDKDRHAPFRLESGKGGSLYLFKDGAVVDNVVNLAKQPAPNIAYGREMDGSSQWGYQDTPTPSGTNCGRLLTTVLGDPTFSVPGAVFTQETTISLTLGLPANAPAGTQIRYTLDGSEPTPSSLLYRSPIAIDQTTLVRAKLYCDGYLSPRSTTQSYIFLGREQTLPVVSLVTDEAFITGDDYGLLGGDEDPWWSNSGTLHFPNFYYDWRRPVNIEYFPDKGQPSVINQLGETRLTGQSSRFFSIKSFIIYANKRFGTKRFQYEFFPDQKPGKDKFKSLILRNAGNDLTSLYMRDAVIQRTMGQNADIDWQAWQPTIVFINGKYYGMLNLRERSNDANIETNYGSEMADNIDMVEYWGKEIKNGDKAHWDEFEAFYSAKGHSVAEYEERIDLPEFNNIMAMNFFFNNYDFPGNNCVWWRPNQEGGRWRILAKDCDFGLNLEHVGVDFPILEWFYTPGYALINGINLGAQGSNEWQFTVMFRNMMENDQYKRLFTNLMAIYMGDFLNERGTREILDPMVAEIEQEIPFYQDAIPNYWERSNFPVNLADARNWLAGRANFMYDHLSQFYSLGKPIPMTVNAEVPEAVQQAVGLSINGVPLRYRTFDGKMFAGRSITLSAQSSDLDITGWKVVSMASDGASNVTQVTGSEYTFTMPASGRLSINVITTGGVLAGDVNRDGRISIDDVTMLIDMLLTGGADGQLTEADVNRDGRVSIDDVTDLIDMLLAH